MAINEFTVRNAEELRRAILLEVIRLDNDRKRLNFLPFLEQLLKDLEQQHENYFDSEVGPGPNRWPELAQSTIDRKGHNEILVDTGRLKASLVGQTADSIREAFQEEGHAWVHFGTDVEYSIYHDNEDGGRLPWRPHVGLAEEDIDAIAGMALDFQVEELKKLV